MKKKVLIVGDLVGIGFDLASQLNNNDYEVVGIVNTGEDALYMINKFCPDNILLDVQIKGDMNGIETAHKINEKYNIPIIFISALAEKKIVESAMKTFPYAYLIKPIRPQDLLNTIELAFLNTSKTNLENVSHSQNLNLKDRILIRIDNASFEKLQLEDILYLEANRSYCTIFSKAKNYTVSSCLNQVLQQISSNQFLRIHKSFAVNIKHISAIKDYQVMVNDMLLPIGVGYRKQLLEIFCFVK
jgi:DNA-binding LytR/AlgR family response regulator